MNDLIEEIEVELPQRARAAIGTCIEINDAIDDIADNMCETCLEPSREVFEAVHEMLVAIIYAVLNKKNASVLVKVSADDEGAPMITVLPDDKVTH